MICAGQSPVASVKPTSTFMAGALDKPVLGKHFPGAARSKGRHASGPAGGNPFVLRQSASQDARKQFRWGKGRSVGDGPAQICGRGQARVVGTSMIGMPAFGAGPNRRSGSAICIRWRWTETDLAVRSFSAHGRVTASIPQFKEFKTGPRTVQGRCVGKTRSTCWRPAR